MYTPKLPSWVAPFCCAMPFFALVGFSVSGFSGSLQSTPSLICLTMLCREIVNKVLDVPKMEDEK